MTYNKQLISELINYIKLFDGISDKNKLQDLVKEKFNLIVDRKVFYCKYFSIRFSQSKSSSFSNTVLSLSAIQKYDQKPFFVCLVMPQENTLFLSNTSLLSKISHSSHELSFDNIKGSFNGSDIMRKIGPLTNSSENFEELFFMHMGFTFEDNLRRLVEATNEIVGRDTRFKRSNYYDSIILDAPLRSVEFLSSEDFTDLANELEFIVNNVKNEIIIASLIDNVNLRGRIIEYLITHGESDGIRKELIANLKNEKNLPQIRTDDGLGDYSKEYQLFSTKTDIKTKILYFNSAPKAYNIDKLLDFLSKDKSIYMIYFIGISDEREIKTHLCSIFENRLIESTLVQFHWAGRNSRGVTQFSGKVIDELINTKASKIDIELSRLWLNKLLKL